jgi:hypothetical protein
MATCEIGSSDVGVYIPCSLEAQHEGPCLAGPNDYVAEGSRCDGRPL